MVVLISFLQAPEDGDGFSRRRLIDHNHLESSFQCLISLKVLLILVQCSGTDGPQFSSCQCRFENIGSIHSARCPAGTDEGMNLIDEQDYLSLTVDHILDYALKTFLELTLIFRTCYKCTHIK